MALLFSLLMAGGASAATVPLTWDDCGDSSYHGHITDLAPMQIPLGTTTTLTGKGTLDEDVDGATFNFKAKIGPLTILKGSGNACEDTTIDLPFNSGNLVVHKVDCPRKAGDVIMKIDVTTKGKVADDSNSLVNINLQVAANNGDKLLCAHLTTQKAMVLMPEDPMRMCSNFVGSVAYNSTEYQCCGGEYGGAIVKCAGCDHNLARPPIATPVQVPVTSDNAWEIKEYGTEWLKTNSYNWNGQQIYIVVEREPTLQAAFNKLGELKGEIARRLKIDNPDIVTKVVPEKKQIEISKKGDDQWTLLLTVTDDSDVQWADDGIALAGWTQDSVNNFK